MIIISSESSKDLASRIASRLGITLYCTEVSKYSLEEIKVSMPECLKNEDAIILFPNSLNSNSNLIEFLLMTELARKKDCKNINAVVPYMPYSRQDKEVGISAIAKLFETAGINKIITIDIHSQKAIDVFNGKLINLSAFDIFSDVLKVTNEMLIVAPDKGSAERASFFARQLNTGIVFIDKTNGNVSSKNLINGKRCVIVDDIIDSGRTLIHTINILEQNRARSIAACITHGVFSDNNINQSKITNIYVSESIFQTNSSDNISALPIDCALSKAILKYFL